MTNIKTQAIELLMEIPDDKVLLVIEILKSLRTLFVRTDDATKNREAITSVMGICHKYANPDLVHLEKEAWGEAMKEKHGNN